LWLAAARTASVRRGSTSGSPGTRSQSSPDQTPASEADTEPASALSRRLASQAVAALSAATETIARHEAHLGELDRVGGDGDHGRGMVRGLTAAREAAEAIAAGGGGLSTALSTAGRAWSDKAGGTSGALWGSLLRACAEATDDQTVPTEEDMLAGAEHALAAVVRLGGASAGEKTMVDAMEPFVR